MRKRVLIESPYAGDVDTNTAYVRACMRDSFKRGEAPFASHGLYTLPGVLSDDDPQERAMGMEAGFAWGEAAELVAVYTDLGISPGMTTGIAHARDERTPIEYRQLPGWAKRL